jgi:hypothetical protein
LPHAQQVAAPLGITLFQRFFAGFERHLRRAQTLLQIFESTGSQS